MRAVFAAVLLLTGCVSSQPIYTADGRQGQAIRCSGKLGSWNGCYQRAGEICGARGYDILQQNEEVGHVASASVNNGTGNAFASDTRDRTMIIKCKGD
jgi:hypothetical protein